MPYIAQDDRAWLAPEIEALEIKIDSVGELNYAITSLVHAWVRGHGVRYETLNAAVGVLACARGEFERRILEPHEDRKIAENGDLPGVEGEVE